MQRVLAVGALLILCAVAGAALLLRDNEQPAQCTMEAKMCPDGTAVGRTGPNCEFAECPSNTTGSEKTIQVAVGEPITFNGETFSVAKVEDSRCAIGHECIWAGEAKVIIASQRPTEGFEIKEGEQGGLFGVQITVERIAPYPIADVTLQQSDYQITVRLSK